MKPKFNPGREVITRGVADWSDPDRDTGATYYKVLHCLKRHITGDWGDVCESDKLENDIALNSRPATKAKRRPCSGKRWVGLTSARFTGETPYRTAS